MPSQFDLLCEELNALKDDNALLNTRFEQAEKRYAFAQRRLRVQASLAFCGFVAAMFLSPANRAVMAQGYGVTLASLNTRLTTLEHTVANIQLIPGPKGDKGDTGPQGPAGTFDGAARVTALETKTQYMNVDTNSKSVTFSGCNLIVNNGLGATNGSPADPTNFNSTAAHVNGLGNLIVGYNISRSYFNRPDVRTGSHNVIVGDANNYSSYGGIVVGEFNTISSSYSSVSGGSDNTASGYISSVSGGANNIASGYLSSVSGGNTNTASGDSSASVSGGALNVASGEFSSISGGRSNTASNNNTSISGGISNTASGFNACVSGGMGNFANGFYGYICGGRNNTASGDYSSITGGHGVIQNFTDGWTGGSYHTP